MSRAYGFGIFVGDTDKRDITSSVLQVPDPFDVEGYVLTKVEWERRLEAQSRRHAPIVGVARTPPTPMSDKEYDRLKRESRARSQKDRMERLQRWQQRIQVPTLPRPAPLLIPGMGVDHFMADCPKCEHVSNMIAVKVEGRRCDLRCESCSEVSTMEWSKYSWGGV